MFDNTKKNSGCDFGKELVSFLYEDFDDLDKTAFQKHLVGCSTCSDEVAAFGAVRSSILDWKEADFNNLPLPNIKIELEKTLISSTEAEISSQKSAWLDNFRNFLSPLFVKTAGGFAALVILLGAGWILFNLYQNDSPETAVTVREEKSLKNETKENIPSAAETKKEIVEKSETEQNSGQKEVALDNPAVGIDLDEKIVEKNKVSSKKSVKRAPVSNLKTKIAKTATKPQNTKDSTEPKKQNPVVTDKAPSLTEFAVEDVNEDEIRLSDIFDEIGSDK